MTGLLKIDVDGRILPRSNNFLISFSWIACWFGFNGYRRDLILYVSTVKHICLISFYH